MKLEFSANGHSLNVKHDLAQQIKRARADHPQLSGTLASLHDDLAKVAGDAETANISVTIELEIGKKSAPSAPVTAVPVRVPTTESPSVIK